MGTRELGPCRRMIGALIGFLVFAAVIIVILYFVVIMEGDIHNLPPEILDYFDSSPPGSDKLTPEEVDKWENNGQGLSLLVVNALDEDWHPYFETAISNWDNGYPDSLSLRASMASAPNSQCEADMGSVMVCNGDYGATGWKGIAEILSSEGTIKAATCRMNEYYLGSRDTDEMQYAMCHELGHAWGLHHTDEQFNNRDLGNCLDYTHRPQNNLTPDQSNYAFLHAMYGLIPGAQPYTAPTAAPAMAQDTTSTEKLATDESGGTDPDTAGDQTAPKKDQKNQNDRILGDELTENSSLPEWLLDAIREARQDHALHGKVELPGGYVLHIHKVLV